MAWERRKRKCELKNIPGNFIAHCNGEIAAHIRRKVNQIACVENIRTIDIEKLNFAPLEYKMLMLSCEKSIYTFNLRCAQTNFLVFNRVVCCTRVWSCDNFRLWYGVWHKQPEMMSLKAQIWWITIFISGVSRHIRKTLVFFFPVCLSGFYSGSVKCFLGTVHKPQEESKNVINLRTIFRISFLCWLSTNQGLQRGFALTGMFKSSFFLNKLGDLCQIKQATYAK